MSHQRKILPTAVSSQVHGAGTSKAATNKQPICGLGLRKKLFVTAHTAPRWKRDR